MRSNVFATARLYPRNTACPTAWKPVRQSELAKKLNDLAEDLAELREIFGSRYDDLKSDRVKPIDGGQPCKFFQDRPIRPFL